MVAVFEEVQRAGRLLMPSICFSTGKEHTDSFYVGKVREILEVTGPDVIVSIKNFAGLGTPKRLGQLVEAIREAFPEIILHYHGCNTDGNDIGRMSGRGPGRREDLRCGGPRLRLHVWPGPGLDPDPKPQRLRQEGGGHTYPAAVGKLGHPAPGTKDL